MSGAVRELETERLLLRMLTVDDFEDYARIHADAEVMRFLGGSALSRMEAFRHMAMIVGHWHLRGYGFYGAFEKQSGRLVGRVGFFNPEGWPAFELGWTMGRDAWGRGYATEAARRCLRYAFEDFGKEHVISLIHPENVRSMAVARKLGQSVEGEAEVHGVAVKVWGIGRDAFLSQDASRPLVGSPER